MKMLIELNLDGYESKEAHDKACFDYVEEMLDSSATYVKILDSGDDLRTREEAKAHMKYELSFYTPIRY